MEIKYAVPGIHDQPCRLKSRVKNRRITPAGRKYSNTDIFCARRKDDGGF